MDGDETDPELEAWADEVEANIDREIEADEKAEAHARKVRDKQDAYLVAPLFAALARGWPRAEWDKEAWPPLADRRWNGGPETWNESAATLGPRFGRRGTAFHTACAHLLFDYGVAYLFVFDDTEPTPDWSGGLSSRKSTPYVIDLNRWQPIGPMAFLEKPPPPDDYWAWPDRDEYGSEFVGATLDPHFKYRAGRLALRRDRSVRKREGKAKKRRELNRKSDTA